MKDNGRFKKGHKLNTTHGMRHTRPYNTWNHMMFRCYHKRDGGYKFYGAKGVTVSEKWHNFEGFWEDMKETYFETAFIDRIDPFKGYSKENCRWVTKEQSGDNKRNSLKIVYQGEEKTLSEWCRILKLNYHKTYLRISRYHYSNENAFKN